MCHLKTKTVLEFEALSRFKKRTQKTNQQNPKSSICPVLTSTAEIIWSSLSISSSFNNGRLINKMETTKKITFFRLDTVTGYCDFLSLSKIQKPLGIAYPMRIDLLFIRNWSGETSLLIFTPSWNTPVFVHDPAGDYKTNLVQQVFFLNNSKHNFLILNDDRPYNEQVYG